MGQLCRLKRPSTAWLAQKYVKGKPSAILSFGVQDGLKVVLALLMHYNSLLVLSILVMPSLACHPATTTHRQLNEEELKSAGVSEDMVRLSVGIEHIDDLIADLEQALSLYKF
jgi:O-acetylhomoserine (thiol)-lyase